MDIAVTVNILATCRKSELLPATLLSFKTIRTGFPTAKIEVDWNGLEASLEQEITREAAESVGASFVSVAHTTHHEWLCSLIESKNEPWWAADTDLVFWSDIEKFNFDVAVLAGRYIPRFKCKFANACTKPRLHTSLLRINPLAVKLFVKNYGEQFPDTYCTPRPNLRDLIFPRYIPSRDGDSHFYDTASLLYQAIGGRKFDERHLDCYDHLTAGTLSDLVAPCYPEHRIRETQFSIFENHQLAKGSWKLQDKFYADHAC